MENQEIDIEALKTDKEFLQNLKKLESEMHDQNSIAKGYQLLDAKLVIESAEDDINDVFTFIVNTAFDKLAQKLTEPSKFDMADPEEWATARAIYEHGIQRYSENDKKGAKEIFLVLYHMIDIPNVKEAMMIHACAVMARHSFEYFIENLVDVEGVAVDDPMAFFVTTFTQPNDMMLSMFSKYVKEGKDELKVLEANS